MKTFALLLSLSLAAMQAPSPEGAWTGIVDAGAFQIHITLKVRRTADGFAATMDAPERNMKDFPADVFTATATGFRVEWKKTGAVFDATYNPDGRSLNGEWSSPEGGISMAAKKTADQAPAPVEKGRALTTEERARAIGELERTHELLRQATAGVSDAQARFKAGPDRWSILEVTEHLAATEPFLSNLAQSLLKAPAQPVRGEAELKSGDDKVLVGVADRSTKAQAPEPAEPTGRYAALADALRAFAGERAKSVEYVRSTGDDLRSHYSASPVGTMDSYQFLLMLAAHTERHVKQIEEVKGAAGYPR